MIRNCLSTACPAFILPGQQLFLHIAHAPPQTVPGFGIHLFQTMQDTFHHAPARLRLVRTILHLLPIVSYRRQFRQIGFVHKAHRADNRHVELLHYQPRRHRTERPLIRNIHQQRFQNIIHVMPQGYFVTPLFLCHSEQSLAPVPRTQETRRLAGIRTRIELRFVQHERHSLRLRIASEVIRIALIRDISHYHMGSNHRKPWLQNPGTTRQQFHQRQRVLAAGKPDKDFIALFYQSVLHHSFGKAFLYTP